MAYGIEYETNGWDKVAAHLAALKRELTGTAQNRMVRAGAAVFKKEMVERAPVLKPGTGGKSSLPPDAIKKGIGVTVSNKTGEAVARVGPRGRWLKLITFDVEYGHREINHGVQGEDVPPHPFVRPTYESKRSEAEEAMIESLNEMLRETDNAG